MASANRLFCGCALSLFCLAGCGKEKTETPTPPAAAHPVAARPPATDPSDALRKQNAELRGEIDALRAQVAALTKTNIAWKEWSEKQSQTTRPVAVKPKENGPAKPFSFRAVEQLSFGKIEVGIKGPFGPEIQFAVSKILGSDEVLLTPSWTEMTFKQVGNGQAVQIPKLRTGLPFVLKGWSTEKLTDNQRFPLKGTFGVIGTKTIPDGRTVFLLTPG